MRRIDQEYRMGDRNFSISSGNSIYPVLAISWSCDEKSLVGAALRRLPSRFGRGKSAPTAVPNIARGY